MPSDQSISAPPLVPSFRSNNSGASSSCSVARDSLVLVISDLLEDHLLRLSSSPTAVCSVLQDLLHAPLLLFVVGLYLRRVLLKAIGVGWRCPLRVHPSLGNLLALRKLKTTKQEERDVRREETRDERRGAELLRSRILRSESESCR